MKVIKRDGRAVDYDRAKIETAITKANEEVKPKERATKAEIKEIITYIEELDKKRILVEDIQDIIEQKLMEIEKYELSKRNIVYRYTRALVRKQNTTDETILGIIRNENKELAEENSNKNTMLASTQRDYIAGEVQDYIGTEMEFYDLVPVGTEMSSLVPEKLVNCGYLDITEDDFPEMKLCWDGKNINILLVTETTYDWLVEKLTPQIFEIQFNVDKNQESVIRERLNQMIRNYNMEFQSKYRHADKLNLFYLDSKSERLLKEQNYIQTSRWLLMSISGILIFIGIMNFANTRISDIMLRQWECKILERVGMTKKQEYRMFVTEGLFYWLLLCGLLMSFGNLGIGIMQWYMKMQISYFAFRYPVKEMIALMVLLLLFSIIFPGIIYKKLKKKRK